MPRVTGYRVGGDGRVTGGRVSGYTIGASASPFAALRDSFGGSVLNARWSTYKPDALDSAVVSDGRVRITAVQGGAGATGAFWYSQDNTTQYDGFTLYQAVGPASGTSVSFDARARVAVFAGDGTSQPPATVGEWRFGGLAIHDPARTYYRYFHACLGTEGGSAVAGLEVKVNRVNVTGGGSVFPVAAIVGDLYRDVRIVRRATNNQIFDVYDRAISGLQLSNLGGWVLRYTIVWDDGEDAADDFPACPQETDAGMPDDVQVSLISYSNATGIDLITDVEEFWIGETED